MPAWAFGTGINNARYFQHLGMIFCPIRNALRELFGKGTTEKEKDFAVSYQHDALLFNFWDG